MRRLPGGLRVPGAGEGGGGAVEDMVDGMPDACAPGRAPSRVTDTDRSHPVASTMGMTPPTHEFLPICSIRQPGETDPERRLMDCIKADRVALIYHAGPICKSW